MKWTPTAAGSVVDRARPGETSSGARLARPAGPEKPIISTTARPLQCIADPHALHWSGSVILPSGVPFPTLTSCPTSY